MSTLLGVILRYDGRLSQQTNQIYTLKMKKAPLPDRQRRLVKRQSDSG
ncbi:MAG: hypothetical protein KC434_13340 [Anaerolineales bacterium]|nr:hypothetical protein [Anaerolineales bacterium]